MTKRNFIPKDFKSQPKTPGFYGISHGLYRSAIELIKTAEKDQRTHSHHILASITLFTATIESYFNEILTLNLLAKKYHSKNYLEALRLGNYSDNKMSFNEKIKAIFIAYDKKQKGIDTNGYIYQDLIALINLRNNIVHYNPDWENIYHYPKDLEHILNRTKIKLENAGWTTNFSNIQIGHWAKMTVKNILVEFSNITGAHNPFTDDESFKSTRWED